MALPDNGIWRISSASTRLNLHFEAIASSFRHFFTRALQGKLSILEMVLCGSLPALYWHFGRRRKVGKLLSQSSTDDSSDDTRNGQSEEKDADTNGWSQSWFIECLTDFQGMTDAEASDPGLLKKYSTIRSYTTSLFTYPSLRIFFREHPQFEKLPKEPSPLPLLVFIHGLGGSVAQFNPLLTSLVNLSSCLSIDLPGCGLSKFEPKTWDAYTTRNLAELLGVIIEEHRKEDQGVVLIGHSMGASLAAMLATKSTSFPNSLSDHVVGLVAICPRAAPSTQDEVSMLRKLLWIPTPIFNLWRNYDRRGGKNSASVARFAGADADDESKTLQYRFNEQSKTPVWRRMASGTLPTYENGIAKGGLPGGDVWAGLEVPVFLVAGEADHITKPAEIEKIASFLGKSHPVQIEVDEDSKPIVDAAAPIDTSTEPSHTEPSRTIESINTEDFLEADPDTAEDMHEDPSTPNDEYANSQSPSSPRLANSQDSLFFFNISGDPRQ